MFGIRYIKAQPTTYIFQYRNGKIVRQGGGLSFFCYAPTTTLVAVPLASTDVPFIFEEASGDFQEISIQGQVTYRISDPLKTSQLLNFTIDPTRQQYVSDDPEKLSQRVINVVKVLTRKELRSLSLREALRSSDQIVQQVQAGLPKSTEIASLGLEILGLSILAIKPTPDTARALEAETREKLLMEADDAIYLRRNAAVEQERRIRENELNTELAIQEKQRQLGEAKMASKIALEVQNKELVALSVENQKNQSDAQAYAISTMMNAISGADPKVVQALASVGMKPNQLMALAFQGLADKADKIGQLNVSPDLLRELMDKR